MAEPMTLHVNVQDGTGAGKRPPYTDSHAPTCACTRCQIEARKLAVLESMRTDGGNEQQFPSPAEMDEAMSEVAGQPPTRAFGQTVDATQPPNIIPLAATTTTCRCGQRVHTLTTGRTTHTLDAPIHGLTERFDATGQVVAYDHIPVWPAHTCSTSA